MPIDVSNLEFHRAGYDAQGNAVLVAKPLSAEFATANAVSRLTYYRTVEREANEVIDAARHANMPLGHQATIA
jgi:hypothetical protein